MQYPWKLVTFGILFANTKYDQMFLSNNEVDLLVAGRQLKPVMHIYAHRLCAL